jgi:single-strand selective monofunctional uracil DNA glycosylase
MKELIASTLRLSEALKPLKFGAPAACVYRPLEYAWKPHARYLERFAKGREARGVSRHESRPLRHGADRRALRRGGGCQGLDGAERTGRKTADEHPKRPVEGFACQRSEVSGRRLWGLFAERFGSADAFFKDHFVLNYCPLVWMSETGANLTPDKLAAAEMAPVERACLAHLGEVIELLRPSFLIGVGAFAEERLRRAAELNGSEARIGRILHPSPASPAANRGWAEAASRQLAGQGVW